MTMDEGQNFLHLVYNHIIQSVVLSSGENKKINISVVKGWLQDKDQLKRATVSLTYIDCGIWTLS